MLEKCCVVLCVCWMGIGAEERMMVREDEERMMVREDEERMMVRVSEKRTMVGRRNDG